MHIQMLVSDRWNELQGGEYEEDRAWKDVH